VGINCSKGHNPVCGGITFSKIVMSLTAVLKLHIKSYVLYYRVIPSDTELFPLTVGHNVNLNKLHAV
jgi:hypothetical protein